MDMFSAYAWPGNVRELENAVRRAAILAASEERERIRASDLPLEIQEYDEQPDQGVVYHTLEEQILSTLQGLKFSRSAISQTARALGNRDRGTITEYLRGLCFQAIVESDFNLKSAAMKIADTDDEGIVERVHGKIQDYVGNLKKVTEGEKSEPVTMFKGLPKKFHTSLQKVLDNLDSVG
jgi:transcriptional regulator with GAF, ATPase, and Fis domain